MPYNNMFRFKTLMSRRWCTQEFYHVHEPHYCHMFETIVAGPKPWRFGHLYLPDGSVNLGETFLCIARLALSDKTM